MPFQYAYIVGCLLLLLFWLFIFLRRKDLRREMLWASFWGMPFGIIDYFLVPTYWNPDSLFGLIKKYGVGIESFIFLFAMSGLASVLYQFLRKRKQSKLTRAARPHFWLLLFFVVAFVILSVLFPAHAIYNLMISAAAGVAVVAFLRRDLWQQMFSSAFIFSFFYFAIFVSVNLLFDGLVDHAYRLENTWGILIVGVPFEEIAVAFFAGAFWSVMYEYTKSYREVAER
jgi:hypothetical protein